MHQDKTFSFKSATNKFLCSKGFLLPTLKFEPSHIIPLYTLNRKRSFNFKVRKKYGVRIINATFKVNVPSSLTV
jgi:hypothetical protein